MVFCLQTEIRLEKLSDDKSPAPAPAAPATTEVKKEAFGIDLNADEEKVVPTESKVKQLMEMGFA